VKEKFLPRGKAFFCKAKTSDGRFERVANAVLGKYRLETTQEEQHKARPKAKKKARD
jgi:hypothetical protein